MSFLSQIWRGWFPERPRYDVMVEEDKNGNWRWCIRDEQGKRLTLMSGLSVSFEEARAQAEKIADARYKIWSVGKPPRGKRSE